MIAYHGSDSNFRKLRIAKELVKRISTTDNEGLGIYFSTNKEVARSYGKYIYTLEVSEKCFIDFRVKSVCKRYVDKLVEAVWNKHKIDISNKFDIRFFVERMYLGGQSISTVGKDIAEILNNTSGFYCFYPRTVRESVYRVLMSFDHQLQAYMFNYHIKDIGVIKDVSEEVVKIVSKENSY